MGLQTLFFKRNPGGTLLCVFYYCVIMLSAIGCGNPADDVWVDARYVDNATPIVKIAWKCDLLAPSINSGCWFSEKSWMFTDDFFAYGGRDAHYGRFSYHVFCSDKYSFNFCDKYDEDARSGLPAQAGAHVGYGKAVNGASLKDLKKIKIKGEDYYLMDFADWENWCPLYLPYSMKHTYHLFKPGQLMVVTDKKGILPKGFEWAYGWWRIEESRPHYEYDLIIGPNYLQYGSSHVSETDYPIYVRDKHTFNSLQLDKDIVIIGNSYVLNKKDKTVLPKELWKDQPEEGSTCKKLPETIDQHVIEEYIDKKVASPLNGKWRSTRGDTMEVDLSDPSIILQKDGKAYGEVVEFEYLGDGKMRYKDSGGEYEYGPQSRIYKKIGG